MKHRLSPVIRERLRALADMIPKKPATYTSQWAGSVEEAFQHYTNTRTVNLFSSVNRCLMEDGWPYPAYLDMREERERAFEEYDLFLGSRLSRAKVLLRMFRGRASMMTVVLTFWQPSQSRKRMRDRCIKKIFRANREIFFMNIMANPLLAHKVSVIRDIQVSYKRCMWASCITTTLPLIDVVIRDLFRTYDLRTSINALSDAFYKADLKPIDLMPGTVWDGNNLFVRASEDDLRLTGVLLSSFFHFARHYYAWYDNSVTPPESLNRHAIIHGAFDDWSEENALRVLTFLDLTLRLEKPLRYLINGNVTPNKSS